MQLRCQGWEQQAGTCLGWKLRKTPLHLQQLHYVERAPLPIFQAHNDEQNT
jgi:hypothetical protein